MNCPYCGKEMESGSFNASGHWPQSLISAGVKVYWQKEWESAVTELGSSLGQLRFEANMCEDCRAILFRY